MIFLTKDPNRKYKKAQKKLFFFFFFWGGGGRGQGERGARVSEFFNKESKSKKIFFGRGEGEGKGRGRVGLE